jgi:hypothetical protein
VAVPQETNVRLPACAVEALGRIKVRRGVSRDKVLRQILYEHVLEQEARTPDDRLTHISTMLRYPASPLRGQPRTDVRMRLRADPDMLERARAVSLRLPGQARRAYRDYQARLLTDAVMTAIAVREPFTDEFLEDLLPLLRHRAVLGFWGLVVAVSSTAAELAVCDKAEAIRAELGPGRASSPPEDRLLLVEEALAEESWHAPGRFMIATNLARRGLRGPHAEQVERMLYEQSKDWNRARLRMRWSRDKSDWFEGVQGADWSGRGGAAVWRAERRVELGGLESWLTSRSRVDGPRSRVMVPPGWSIEIPAGWEALVLPANGEVPAQLRKWVDAGRVMLIATPSWSTQVLWPLKPGYAAPVRGAEPLVAIARSLPPEQVIQFVEAILVEWGAHSAVDEELYSMQGSLSPIPFMNGMSEDLSYAEEEELWASFFNVVKEPATDEEPHSPMPLVDTEFEEDIDQDDAGARKRTPDLLVPVDQAFKYGFVTAEERRLVMADARAYTMNLPNGLFAPPPRKVPAPVSANDPRFRLLVTQRRTKQTAKPMWVWPGRSVVAEIGTDTPSEVIDWLATWAHWTAKRELQRSMEQAWHAGFDHHPASHWHQVPLLSEDPDDV